jgi:hypothetical protein
MSMTSMKSTMMMMTITTITTITTTTHIIATGRCTHTVDSCYLSCNMCDRKHYVPSHKEYTSELSCCTYC